jgi:hypothetical protein
LRSPRAVSFEPFLLIGASGRGGAGIVRQGGSAP